MENVVNMYLPDDFQRLFHLRRGIFGVILHNIGPLLPRRNPLLMTLWYIGSQETIKSIYDRFNVQESTFISHNRRMLDFVCGDVRWPTEKIGIIESFEEVKGVSGVLGAVDGTHISITPPAGNEPSYANDKGFHSSILQAVCFNDRSFTGHFL